MRLRSFRLWLGLGLVVASLAAGGIYTLRWWRAQPQQLFDAAQKAFADAEQAFQRHAEETSESAKRSHRELAKKRYGEAEAALRELLDEQKLPRPSDAWLLRYRVLSQLAFLTDQEERERGETDDRRTSQELARNAWWCVQQAGADPTCSLAQALLLDGCFREDRLEQALPYATNLVEHAPAADQLGAGRYGYLMGARFALARAALRADPPRPDEALEHLQASAALQKEAEASKPAGTPRLANPLPRWRAVALEALALKLKAAPSKTGRASRNQNAAAPKKEEETPRDRLRNRVAIWLDRAGKENAETAAEPSRTIPPPPPLATLSVSDVRGLYNFLLLAVEVAADRREVLERTQFALTVFETMTGKLKPSDATLREMVRYVTRLPGVMDKQAIVYRPRPAEWNDLSERMERLLGAASAAGVPVEPAAYLDMARYSKKNGLLETATRQTGKGIKAAEGRRLPADDKTLQELHAQAAWYLLLQGNLREAEQHLAPLRKNARQMGGIVLLVGGLIAVQDGRLDEGVRDLRLAQQHPQFSQTVYSHLGLAFAFAAQGKDDQAAGCLEKIEQYFAKAEPLPEDERAVADQLLPDRAALYVELLRCQLALGKYEQALSYKTPLQDSLEGVTASVVLLQHYLSVAKTHEGGRQAAVARQALDAARKELTAARQLAPDDVRLLLAETELLLRESPAGREKAEALLRLRAFDMQSKTLDAQYAWVSWLLRQGRLDEAGQALRDLEKSAGANPSRQVQFLRACWQLAHDPINREADQLLEGFPPVQAPGAADNVLAGVYAVLTRQESSGLQHYSRGVLAHARGDFRQAARAYERSLSFAALKELSQRGLLACILKLRAQDSPAAAYELAADLLRGHPDDPVLLLAFAESARLMDHIYGDQGMEGVLRAAEDVLRGEGVEAALCPYYQARAWLAAGRPDLARRHVLRALGADAGHVLSLLLAGQVALAEEDWDLCLEYAAAVEKKDDRRIEPRLWRATALARQGKWPEARKGFHELIDRFPGRPEGYLGLAQTYERNHDYPAALFWLTRWRDRSPQDLAALTMEMRLLAKNGRLKEVAQRGDEALAGAPSETAVLLAVARGLLEARALDAAETWTKRALAAAEKKQPADGLAAVLDSHCLLGDLAVARCRNSQQAADRSKWVDQAIEHFKKVYEQSPGHRHAGGNLARLLCQERGQPDAAYAIVQRLRQNPYSQALITGDRLPLDLVETAAVIYRDGKRPGEAVALLQEAARRYGSEPVVYYQLGRASAALAKPKEAVENLNHAVHLAEDRAEATEEPEEKARWQDLAAEARGQQQRLTQR